MLDKGFYKGKRVLITGHTGFKGGWLCEVLKRLGAEVTGYALAPSDEPGIFSMCDVGKGMHSVIGDIRDLKRLLEVFDAARPEIVIHMAAQPLVRESYQNPVYTYDVNVMGTVNVMECIRLTKSVRSVVNVTTDKVYKNREWEWGYRENEELNGFDPYSNSKSCSELVTDSYRNSFFKEREIAVSTARAGNVIGGGDFAKDRLLPDCVRAAIAKEAVIIRNPYSVRPYQHVLEAVMAYLTIAQEQYKNKALAGSYNIGPEERDCWETGKLAELFGEKWKSITGDTLSLKVQYDGGPHEARFLKLDCSRIKFSFDWKPVWNIDEAVGRVAEWTYAYQKKEAIDKCMSRQIRDFLAGCIEEEV